MSGKIELIELDDDEESVADEYGCPMCDVKSNEKSVMLTHIRSHRFKRTAKAPAPPPPAAKRPAFEFKKPPPPPPPSTTAVAAAWEPCGECGRTFSSLIDLGQHVLKMHTKLPTAAAAPSSNDAFRVPPRPRGIKCGNCGVVFPSAQQICSHECKSQPPPTSSHRCRLCPEQFAEADRLMEHLKDVHKKFAPRNDDGRSWNYKCVKCEAMFSSTRELEAHSCGGETAFDGCSLSTRIDHHRCTLCPAQFIRKSSLVDHWKVVHNRARAINHHQGGGRGTRTGCLHCKMHFSTRQRMLQHVHNYHQTAKLYCYDCEDGFYAAADLEKHARVRHRYLVVKCPICHRTMLSLKHLGIHVAATHPDFPSHKCDDCAEIYVNKTAFEKHMVNRHTSAAKIDRRQKLRAGSYRCCHCSVDMLSLTKLDDHLEEAHGGIRGFTCPLCKVNFSKEAILLRHLTFNHSLSEGSRCYLCGEHFDTGYLLWAHVRKAHLDKGTFRCPVAGCATVNDSRSAFKMHHDREHVVAKPPPPAPPKPKSLLRVRDVSELMENKKAPEQEAAAPAVRWTIVNDEENANEVMVKVPTMTKEPPEAGEVGLAQEAEVVDVVGEVPQYII